MPEDADTLTAEATQATADTATSDLTLLLFTVFVFITDTDRDITPQEVRILHGLSTNTRWTTNAAMRRALAPMRTEYPKLWSRYEDKTLGISRAAIDEQLRNLQRSLPKAEAEALRTALRQFVGRFEPSGLAALLGSGIATGGRARARSEVQDLLAARLPAAAAEAEIAPAPAPAPARPAAASAVPGLADLPVWTRGRTRVRCVSVTPETPDVKTFRFVAQPACLFDYRPGQFVTLELPIDGRLVRRSYTISSSPSRPFLLAITVKRNPGGFVSAWLHDIMREGFELDLHGPNGDFSCAEHAAEKLLLLSGGSGVTPMMSMLRHFADTAPWTDIAFINSVRSPDDIIFGAELQQLSAQFGSALRLGILPSSVGRGQSWSGMVGRLDAARLTMLVPDVHEREAFVCGPPSFTDAAQAMLRELGHPAHRFHQESFGPAARSRAVAAPAAPKPTPLSAAAPAAPPATPPPQPTADETVTIVFARSGVTHTGSAEDCLLDIGEAHGVAMNCSCRSGVCGTCRVKVTTGTVRMGPQGILSEDEVAEGHVLACITRGTGRITIDA